MSCCARAVINGQQPVGQPVRESERESERETRQKKTRVAVDKNICYTYTIVVTLYYFISAYYQLDYVYECINSIIVYKVPIRNCG